MLTFPDAFAGVEAGEASKNLALVDRVTYESGMTRTILQSDRLNNRSPAHDALQLTMFFRALQLDDDPGFTEFHLSQSCCYSREHYDKQSLSLLLT